MPDMSFGVLLRRWRAVRHLSQLDLALDAEISTRHLSCVETGRAQPSREMVLRLAEALQVPLRERNALLLAAGYAPLYHFASFHDKLEWFENGPMDVQVFGNVAVAQGSVKEKRSRNGKDTSGEFAWMDLLEK